MILLSKCPACGSPLSIKALQCSGCGLELRNEFELSAFDRLETEELDFLMCFLRCRGNLSMVQDEMRLSYPTAKKKLSSLLTSLGLEEDEIQEKGEIDMEQCITDAQSSKASEIIKTKLKEAGGRAIVHSISGNAYELKAEADGKSFSTEALPIRPNYTYEVFDVIVDLLLSQGGKARKGLGRNARLGERNCEENTVVGAVGKRYSGNKLGEYVYDPVFFLAAGLDWAGIAHNRRGYLEITKAYNAKLEEKDNM